MEVPAADGVDFKVLEAGVLSDADGKEAEEGNQDGRTYRMFTDDKFSKTRYVAMAICFLVFTVCAFITQKRWMLELHPSPETRVGLNLAAATSMGLLCSLIFPINYRSPLNSKVMAIIKVALRLFGTFVGVAGVCRGPDADDNCYLIPGAVIGAGLIFLPDMFQICCAPKQNRPLGCCD